MKKHITATQWGEFERENPAHAKKLQDYYSNWQLKYEEERYPNQFVTIKYELIFNWLTFDQMVEFLGDKLQNISPPYKYDDEDKQNKWVVGIWKDKEQISGTDFLAISLIDALWLAIKYVLSRA